MDPDPDFFTPPGPRGKKAPDPDPGSQIRIRNTGRKKAWAWRNRSNLTAMYIPRYLLPVMLKITNGILQKFTVVSVDRHFVKDIAIYVSVLSC